MKYLHFDSNTKPPLAIRLLSYRPFNVLFRIIIIGLIAVGILHFVSSVVSETIGIKEHIPRSVYPLTIAVFILAAESQIILDNILEYVLPIPKKIRLRIAIQIGAGIIFLFIAHHLINVWTNSKIIAEPSKIGLVTGLALGLVFVQLIANSLTVARLTQKMLDAQEEIASMKREKLLMDYQSLQNQLNPHFLFNNLSVLKSLIIYDRDAAVDFIEKFTDVYRYVLQSKDKHLVKLSEEMEFINAYAGLHKERLGDGLVLNFRIAPEDRDKKIAPLTLQLLVENAIKHNIAGRDNPLDINISSSDGYLTVCNKLNRRQTSYSTQTGLKNLVKRYELLSRTKVIVQYDDLRFEVKIPLIEEN